MPPPAKPEVEKAKDMRVGPSASGNEGSFSWRHGGFTLVPPGFLLSRWVGPMIPASPHLPSAVLPCPVCAQKGGVGTKAVLGWGHALAFLTLKRCCLDKLLSALHWQHTRLLPTRQLQGLGGAAGGRGRVWGPEGAGDAEGAGPNLRRAAWTLVFALSERLDTGRAMDPGASPAQGVLQGPTSPVTMHLGGADPTPEPGWTSLAGKPLPRDGVWVLNLANKM
ncbi:hypothetical protein H8959_003553 [Pygathrix nigripes]